MTYLLLSIAKLQNLKAIHNERESLPIGVHVVINHKTTKFESNSQLSLTITKLRYSCYQSQNYKIWKQFTTSQLVLYNFLMLLSITKLQNLKAIHNDYHMKQKPILVVINRKTTKFESNSQLQCACNEDDKGCYQSQNYKIWKQFTTLNVIRDLPSELLSIAKLQKKYFISNKA